MATENYKKCVDEIQAVSEKYEQDAEIIASLTGRARKRRRHQHESILHLLAVDE